MDNLIELKENINKFITKNEINNPILTSGVKNIFGNIKSLNISIQNDSSYKEYPLYSIEYSYFLDSKKEDLFFEDSINIYFSKSPSATNILESIRLKKENNSFFKNKLISSDRFYSSLWFYNNIYNKLNLLIKNNNILKDLINERIGNFKINYNFETKKIKPSITICAYSTLYPVMEFTIQFSDKFEIESLCFGSNNFKDKNFSQQDYMDFFICKYLLFRDNKLNIIDYNKLKKQNFQDVNKIIQLMLY